MKAAIIALGAASVLGATSLAVFQLWPRIELWLFPKQILSGASFFSEHRDPKRDATQIELKGTITEVKNEPSAVHLVVVTSRKDIAVTVDASTSWFCAATTYTSPDGQTYKAEDVYLDLSKTWGERTQAEDSPPATEVITNRFIGKTVQVVGEQRNDEKVEARFFVVYGCP